MQQKMKKRLLFFPLPLVGHQNTILGLASFLHTKGLSISVISTRLHAPNPTKYPDFSFHLIDDGFTESEASSYDVLVKTKLLNQKCVGPFRECLSQILSDASGDDKEPVTCIIADAMLHFSKGVADELNVPWIALRTGAVTFFATFFAIPFLREKRHLALRDHKPTEDLVPELPPLRVKDLLTYPGEDQSPLDDMLHNLFKAVNTSKGLIFNSFEGLEENSLAIARETCPIPVFPIGPFHKYLPAASSTDLPSRSRDQTILSWLDTQAPNSVLYVSFGSVVKINMDWFLEVAHGLAACSNRPFLWVVRTDLVCGPDGSNCDDPLPNGFLEGVSGRGRVIPWAPQQDVLAHPAVGGFWTHGGWNSTLESICEGVPMICTPMFGDQMLNTRYVTHVWKIGFELDMAAKREDVEKTVVKLMEDEEVREIAESLKNKARNCLLPGGSSCKYMEDLVQLIMSL